MKQEMQGLESQKCIMFDLNINEIKTAIIEGEAKFKSYTTAYNKIRRYLEKGGFEHEQGSGYTSKSPMSVEDVQNVFFTLGEKNTWLSTCMTKCRLSSFEEGALKYTDLMQDIKDGAKAAKDAHGERIISVPNNYKPTKDPTEKAKADALRETLRTTNIKSASVSPPSSARTEPGKASDMPGKAPEGFSPSKPLKPPDKGKGKDNGFGK
jgi:virulence-associated protein VapD